jgi:transposase
VATKKLAAYLQTRPPSRVVVETCAEAFGVADAALSLGHEARVVPATLVKSLGVGAHGVKTDRRDARVLSEVSSRVDLPSVHIPSPEARGLKSQSGMRQILIECRTKLVNGVRGQARATIGSLSKKGVKNFPVRVRQQFADLGRTVPAAMERVLLSIEFLTTQIEAANEEVRRESMASPACRLLRTAPCIGPVTATSFVAAIDDVSRFSNGHSLESYLGLAPGEHSSSERQHRTAITKAGPPRVRRALIQACWVLWQRRPTDPVVVWAKQVAERRGRSKAITAMARKMAGILYAMWRDGTPYDPLHGQREAVPSTAKVYTLQRHD